MLGTFIDDVERRRKRMTVYGDEGDAEVAERLATRNVTVEDRPLSAAGPDPFVTVRDDGDEYVGTVTLADLEALLTPPIGEVGTTEGRSPVHRALMDLFEEAVFTALDRRQLLAASREFEDRAYRVGNGELHVGFQSLSVFRSQVPLYRRLGSETDLEIHVRGEPDWAPPTIEDVTYHNDDDGAFSRFWYLAFDGGDDVSQACALVACEREDGYVGFWTYEPHLVGEITATVREAE